MAHEQRWVNEWQVPVVRAVRGGGSTQIDSYGGVNQALSARSWGREWVSTQVAIPDVSPIYSNMARLRSVVGGLIIALAVLGLMRGVALCALGNCRPRAN